MPTYDAREFPIVPPIDVHGTGDGRLSNRAMRVRIFGPFFGARRGGHSLRPHEGLDLLGPAGTPVTAAATGRVVGGSSSSIRILHTQGEPFFTFYQHIQNKVVAVNEAVGAGQKIAEVGGDPASDDTHLHFEIRVLAIGTTSPVFGNSMPIDPTRALYRWEVQRFYTGAPDDTQTLPASRIVFVQEIRRFQRFRFLKVTVAVEDRDGRRPPDSIAEDPHLGEVLDLEQKAHAIRLPDELGIESEVDVDYVNLFIPYIDDSVENLAMIETVKQAFLHGKRAQISFRESFFFSQVLQEFGSPRVITEVLVVA